MAKLRTACILYLSLVCSTDAIAACGVRPPPKYSLTEVKECTQPWRERNLVVKGVHHKVSLVRQTIVPVEPSLNIEEWVLENDTNASTCDEIVGQTFETVEHVPCCDVFPPSSLVCKRRLNSLTKHQWIDETSIPEASLYYPKGVATVIGHSEPFTGKTVRYSTQFDEYLRQEVVYLKGEFTGRAITTYEDGSLARVMTREGDGREIIREYSTTGELTSEEVKFAGIVAGDWSTKRVGYSNRLRPDGTMGCHYRGIGGPCEYQEDGSVVE